MGAVALAGTPPATKELWQRKSTHLSWHTNRSEARSKLTLQPGHVGYLESVGG